MVSEDEDEETGKVVTTEDLNAELREAARNREVSRTAHFLAFAITDLG